MISTRPNKQKNRIFTTLAAALFWLGVWQLFAMLIHQELILPSPLNVLKTLGKLMLTRRFYQNTLTTLGRILAGYLLGILLSCLLAFLTCTSRYAHALLAPLIRIIRATPVASFIILALLWMGKSRLPVLIATLMVIPVLWQNLNEAYASFDEKLIEMGKAYRMNTWEMLRYIYFPGMLPAFSSGCVSAMGLAWKSGIAAEVLSQPSLAIGTNLYNSKVYLETAELFAWTLVVILLSLLIEKGIMFFFSRVVRNRRKYD